MSMTLTIIKPDSVAAGNAGNILAHLEKEGFKPRALRMIHLRDTHAQAFYEIHKERPFFGELVSFMTEGPCLAIALEREDDDAVPKLREVMGATNSKEAAAGTIRNLYGTDIERNAIHGSDSDENAAKEIAFFFSRAELIAAGV